MWTQQRMLEAEHGRGRSARPFVPAAVIQDAIEGGRDE